MNKTVPVVVLENLSILIPVPNRLVRRSRNAFYRWNKGDHNIIAITQLSGSPPARLLDWVQPAPLRVS